MSSVRCDVLIIGGGHAGCEAARAAARLGARTLLLTLNRQMIAQMSCNPSIGGIAKGHLVREIDAMGGLMARAADQAGIQFRLLNRSRGPAVQAPRAQCDKRIYRRTIQAALAEEPLLSILEGEAAELLHRSGRVIGVETAAGEIIRCRAVVLTTGTFLGGLCFLGEQRFRAGRSGEPASLQLSRSIRSLGLETGRLKTGTPPRVRRETVDLRRLRRQEGDPEPTFFSLETRRTQLPQIPCWLTSTNPKVHQIIRSNLDRSPLYSGRICGLGPRYCPSIEDKVVKFSDRPSHQLFLEPETVAGDTIYINGLSTSMPIDVQVSMLEQVPGLEAAQIIRPGYAVEYDFVQPRQLDPSLQTRALAGLFHAGQINGTTGYEEAAAQGLVAGINAAQLAMDREPLVLPRSESYIGILIDDLVTRGVDEPYRMFTSRAEYRLLLRIDNADRRLAPVGRELGLVDESLYARLEEKWLRIDRAERFLSQTRLAPAAAEAKHLSGRFAGAAGSSLAQLLRRPECRLHDLTPLLQAAGNALTDPEMAALEARVKYRGYIDLQRRDVQRVQRLENLPLPADLDYRGVAGLSNEMVEKLSSVRPATLGQASRIPGVTAAAVSILTIHLQLSRRSP